MYIVTLYTDFEGEIYHLTFEELVIYSSLHLALCIVSKYPYQQL